jgi:hypothetical protein
MEYKDFLGQEIKVGSFIVYPGRYSSSLYVQLGIVRALDTKATYFEGNKPVLKVQSVNRYDMRGNATLNAGGTLTELQRVTVVPRASVPECLAKLLEGPSMRVIA